MNNNNNKENERMKMKKVNDIENTKERDRNDKW